MLDCGRCPAQSNSPPPPASLLLNTRRFQSITSGFKFDRCLRAGLCAGPAPAINAAHSPFPLPLSLSLEIATEISEMWCQLQLQPWRWRLQSIYFGQFPSSSSSPPSSQTFAGDGLARDPSSFLLLLLLFFFLLPIKQSSVNVASGYDRVKERPRR